MHHFIDYSTLTKSNPIKKHVFVGKDGKSDYEERERPLTYEGFKVYCMKNVSDVHHYFENTEGRYEAYRDVCRAIKSMIRADQIEGGMANIYNPSITQRLNNLTEKVETKQVPNVTIKGISQDELDEILNK